MHWTNGDLLYWVTYAPAAAVFTFQKLHANYETDINLLFQIMTMH